MSHLDSDMVLTCGHKYLVKELLKDPAIAIIDKDQSLPEPPQCAFGEYTKNEVVKKCLAMGNKMKRLGYQKVILPSEELKEEGRE